MTPRQAEQIEAATEIVDHLDKAAAAMRRLLELLKPEKPAR